MLTVKASSESRDISEGSYFSRETTPAWTAWGEGQHVRMYGEANLGLDGASALDQPWRGGRHDGERCIPLESEGRIGVALQFPQGPHSSQSSRKLTRCHHLPRIIKPEQVGTDRLGGQGYRQRTSFVRVRAGLVLTNSPSFQCAMPAEAPSLTLRRLSASGTAAMP